MNDIVQNVVLPLQRLNSLPKLDLHAPLPSSEATDKQFFRLAKP